MCQWLIGAAHDSEADVDIVFFHERGNDGMKGTLARSERIGVAGIEGDKSAAILQHKSHAEHRNAWAERIIVALNQRSNIAVFVDRSEIPGVAPRQISIYWLAV